MKNTVKIKIMSCESRLVFGDLVYGSDNITCRSFMDKKRSDVFIGICQNNIVVPNNKIQVMTSVDICIWLEYNQIPMGQKIYISENGTFCWRKNNKSIGKSISNQNEDGFLNIKIKSHLF